MQKRHVNGPSKPHSLKQTKQDTKPKGIGSYKNGKPSEKSIISSGCDLKVYNEDEDLDIAPYVVRKDRLILELESSLAEMDGQCSSATQLQQQKTAAEEQRNVLLKEIESTVSEIQGHVLNAREMEIEKKAIENECIGLRKQVEHLRTVLDDKQTTNHWNHVDLMGGDDSMHASLAHANSKIQTLEKEVKKLRLANERMHLKEKSSKGSEEVEKLKKENEELQKLLQAAEESENNIAHELATCHQTMMKMKQKYEQLEKDNLYIKAKNNSLELEKTELEAGFKKLQDLHDKQDESKIRKDPAVPSTRFEAENLMLQKKLEKNEEERERLDNENNAHKKQVQDLKTEINELKHPKTNGQRRESSSEQLRPALAKLNKENSELHLQLEKAEKELSVLKKNLEERVVENSEDLVVEKNQKKKPEKPKGKVVKSKESAKKSTKNSVKDDKKIDADDEGIENMKDEIEELKRQNMSKESECQALSETVTKIAGEKRVMNKVIEDLTNDKENLQRKLKDLEFRTRELEIIKARKEELDKNFAELQTKEQEISSDLENANASNAMIHNQLERATAEKDALMTERQEFQKSLESIKKEMEDVRKDVGNKSNEIKLLRKKHEEEKRRLIVMKDGGDKETSRLQNQLREIWKQLGFEEEDEPASQQVDTTIKKLQSEVKELKKENEELGKMKIAIEEELEGVEKKSGELMIESAKANDLAMEKAVELSRTKRSYEKKIEKMNKETAELRKKLGELSPAMSTSPRISPEPIQVQDAQGLESENYGPTSARSEGIPNHGSHQIQRPQATYERNSGPRQHSPEGRRPPPYVGRSHVLEPPPFPINKRKSLDDVFREQQQRYLPPYPGRQRRTSDSGGRSSRTHSGSIVTVVASTLGDKQDVTRSSFPKERRRSHGGQRSTELGYRSEPQSPTDQEPTFQVVGYRKVIQEHYV